MIKITRHTHSRLFLFIVSMPVSSREVSGAAAGANMVVRECGMGHTKGRREGVARGRETAVEAKDRSAKEGRARLITESK